MATTTKGRSHTGSRSTWGGGYSGFSWGPGAGTYGRTGTGTGAGTGTRTRKTTRRTGAAGGTGYKSVCNTCEQKINSYRMLWNQAKGPAKANAPTPSTLNTFCNWINKGAVVQVCTPAQVSRWARSANKTFNPRTASPTTCKSILTKKFGKTAIKAVARNKSGGFIVATAPKVNGRTFTFPR